MRDEFGENAGLAGVAIATPVTPGAAPVVTLDVALYERYLAESEMSDEQKREFLEMLWSIIVGFVDLGFAVDPVHQALASDGGGQNTENSGSGISGLILSDDLKPTNTTPNLRAEIEAAGRKGRRQ